MSESPEITGGCLCGRVRYRVTGPVLWSSHCHCHYCRAAHGAAFVTWFGVDEQEFGLEAGNDSLRWYQSSVWSRRGFCSDCGTTLFFQSRQSPNEMHIALATADSDFSIKPSSHVFYDQHVSWLEINDDLPRIDSQSVSLAAYSVIPAVSTKRREQQGD